MRFADDVLLFAKTRRSLQIMITGLQVATGAAGLQLHPEKTKVITNGQHATQSYVTIPDGKIEILSPETAVKYLGKQLAMENMHETDFNHRISAAWACFGRHRTELTNKAYALKDRLRLFSATVTPTALYGCETWVLKQEQQRRLKTTQRKMLRAVLGAKRRVMDSSDSSRDSAFSADDSSSDDQELEPWPEFLKRPAKMVGAKLENSKIDDWSTLWRKRQWRWAGKLLHKSHHKWSYRVLLWDPPADCGNGGRRMRARPRKRWEDDLKQFLKSIGKDGSWEEVATLLEEWRALEGQFLSHWDISSSNPALEE